MIEGCHPRQIPEGNQVLLTRRVIAFCSDTREKQMHSTCSRLTCIVKRKKRSLSCDSPVAWQAFSHSPVTLLNQTYFEDLDFWIKDKQTATDSPHLDIIFSLSSTRLLHMSSSFHWCIFRRYICFHAETLWIASVFITLTISLKCLLGESTFRCLLWKATQTLRTGENLSNQLSPCLTVLKVLVEMWHDHFWPWLMMS